jgi:hypothetical protein
MLSHYNATEKLAVMKKIAISERVCDGEMIRLLYKPYLQNYETALQTQSMIPSAVRIRPYTGGPLCRLRQGRGT